jgi:phosphomannomutase
MREHDIMIGGEESGGIGFRGYLPERDGLLAGLLFLELLAKSGKSCSRLVAELESEFGVSRYGRIDVHTGKAQSALAKLRSAPPSVVAGTKVAKVNASDGLKLILPDDSWLLFRASGTEPLLRIYAESDRDSRTNELLHAGAKLAGVSQK